MRWEFNIILTSDGQAGPYKRSRQEDAEDVQGILAPASSYVSVVGLQLHNTPIQVGGGRFPLQVISLQGELDSWKFHPPSRTKV